MFPKKKRCLREANPAEYERKYKVPFEYGSGCACCDAMGISFNDDDYECEVAEPEEPDYDSLDEEEDRLADEVDRQMDDGPYGRSDGLRKVRFTYVIHPTETTC